MNPTLLRLPKLFRRRVRRAAGRQGRRIVAMALSAALAVPPGVVPVWAADAAKVDGRVTLDGIDAGTDQVTLKLSGPVKYNTFVTASPPRLVLEMLNTEASLAAKSVAGKGQILKRVRAGQFAGEPNPIARIVLDLAKPVNYRVATSGNDLIVRLETGEAAPSPTPAAKAPEAKVPEVKASAAKAPEAKAPEVKPAPAKAPETKPAAPSPEKPAAAKAEPAKPAEAKPAAAKPVEAKPAAPAVAAAPAAVHRTSLTTPAAKPEQPPEMPAAFSTANSRELSAFASGRPQAERAAAPAPVAGPVRRGRDILATLPRDPITLDLDDVDVRDALKMLATKASINLIYGPEVAGNVSVHLDKVPFAEAFNLVLSMNKLIANQVGQNILQITTSLALKEYRDKAVGMTRVYQINYAQAAALKTTIDAVRTAEGRKGSVVVDDRNNQIIVTESPEGLASVERLLAELDTRPKQVLIEAKLVEVKLNKDLHMGIQWDYFSVEPGKALGKYGSTAVGSTMGLPDPFANPRQGTGLDTNALKFPGAVTTGALGAAGRGTGVLLPADKVFGALTLGRITNNYLLSATLTAAAAQGKVKVLSDPKIATLNGKQANINITTQTPYITSNVTSTGVTSQSVTYVTTGIQLGVKPTINADGRITLEVNPQVSQPSATGAGGITGAPGIDARQAQTTVMVRDGETIVIGGLITDSVSNQEAKIPILGDIPILGWLFKKKSVVRQRVELLIFVTTKVMPD